MPRLSFALLMATLIGAMAHAASLPRIAFLSMGFRETTVADFARTPQAVKRRADPYGFLSITADFNGDGKPDEARLLLNAERKVAYVVAVIESATKVDTFVLSQMPLKDASDVGITTAKPLPDSSNLRGAGVTIFSLNSGAGEANYFDGEEFNRRVPVPAKSADTT